jgi:hypothetical protein
VPYGSSPSIPLESTLALWVAADMHDRATDSGLPQLRDIVQPDLSRTRAGSGNSRKNAAAHVLVDLSAVLEFWCESAPTFGSESPVESRSAAKQ